MRSCSLPSPLNNETGRKFDGSELSPFLGSGITLEYFQLSANLPSLKDRLKIILSGTAISFATGFNILLLIPSGPLALFGFKMSIKVLISSTVHVILDNLFKHLNSKGGRRQLSSDIVDIDTKYSLRRSAFSGSVKQNVSCPFGNLVLSGGG